jgi:hypothetical protein
MNLPLLNNFPKEGDILKAKETLPSLVYPHFISIVEDAHDSIIPGNEYTVVKCEVYRSWCAVWLKELPSQHGDRKFHLAFFDWKY